VVVVLVLVALLGALWASTLTKARDRSRMQQCMSRLQTIGIALASYRQANGGDDPRVAYKAGARPDVSGAGAAAADPFGPGGPPANSVPAALFLLVRAQEVPPNFLLCPAALAADPDRWAPDDFAGLDPTSRSNFSDVRRNLAYSFFFTYTSGKGALSGVPVAADLNPGPVAAVGPVVAAELEANAHKYRKANSNNHRKAGQLVLYDDYSVSWYTTPFAGLLVGQYPDNIYATRQNTIVDAPTEPGDAILLPAEE
jgi:type II secretory pathway pseudopilin PulG